MEWNGSILIASGVALGGILITMRNHKVDFLTKEKQDRKEKINKQLVEFYTPLMTYLHTTKALSLKLFVGKPEDFNILTYLLDKEHLFHGDQKVTLTEEELKLVNELINLSEKIEKLVIEKGGLVEDRQLTMYYEPNSQDTDISLSDDIKHVGLLGLLLSHYKILKYARDGIISGDTEYYNQFKFPREIVKVIERNYQELKDEFDEYTNTYLSVIDFVKETLKKFMQ